MQKADPGPGWITIFAWLVGAGVVFSVLRLGFEFVLPRDQTCRYWTQKADEWVSPAVGYATTNPSLSAIDRGFAQGQVAEKSKETEHARWMKEILGCSKQNEAQKKSIQSTPRLQFCASVIDAIGPDDKMCGKIYQQAKEEAARIQAEQ